MTVRFGLLQGLLILFLTGCVSSGTGNRPVNKEKAVNDYISLAKGYVQQGLAEKAVQPLKRALEIDPKSAEVYGFLGMVYNIQDEAALAEKSFKQALAYNKNASDVRNNFGAFLFQKDRLTEAYREFSIASEDTSYTQRSRTFENMGVVSLRLGKQARALKHFDKALRLNSRLPVSSLEVADIYFKQGDREKAWQYYQRFTELSRQNARSLWLGIQLARMFGDKNKVASYALQLEQLYPTSKELKQYRSRFGYE